MLCGRANTSQDAVKLMLTPKDSEGFIMEEKLDGERIQLHKRGNEFYFCSRYVSFGVTAASTSTEAILTQQGEGLHISLWK